MEAYRPHDAPEAAGRRFDGNGDSGRRISTLIGELKEYSAYFLSTKADGLKTSLRQVGVYAALGMVGLIALASIICVSVVLLLVGAAGGIGAALGGQIWIGDLIIGAFILLSLSAGIVLGLGWFSRSMRAKTVKKYEQRQSWQRGQFGRDVEETAAAKHE